MSITTVYCPGYYSRYFVHLQSLAVIHAPLSYRSSVSTLDHGICSRVVRNANRCDTWQDKVQSDLSPKQKQQSAFPLLELRRAQEAPSVKISNPKP